MKTQQGVVAALGSGESEWQGWILNCACGCLSTTPSPQCLWLCCTKDKEKKCLPEFWADKHYTANFKKAACFRDYFHMGEWNHNLNRYSSFPGRRCLDTGNLLTHDPARLGWLLVLPLTSWNTLSQLMLAASGACSYGKVGSHSPCRCVLQTSHSASLVPLILQSGWFLRLEMLDSL